MTSKTVAALLSDPEVTRSLPRPKVSNDGPYSEAWFTTLTYAPTFPQRVGTLADARGLLGDFVQWCNHEHSPTGIGLHSPADVHYGLAAAKANDRLTTLAVARAANPTSFTSSTPTKKTMSIYPTQPESTSTAGSVSRVTPTGLNHLDKYRPFTNPRRFFS